MQRQIKNNAHQVQSFNALYDIVKVESLDYFTETINFQKKIDKLENLDENHSMDFNLVKYIPGLADVATQGKVDNFNNKRKYANENCKDKNTLEFNIQLTKNHYINFSALYVCFPAHIRSKANNSNDIEAGTILVNNFLLILFFFFSIDILLNIHLRT